MYYCAGLQWQTCRLQIRVDKIALDKPRCYHAENRDYDVGGLRMKCSQNSCDPKNVMPMMLMFSE